MRIHIFSKKIQITGTIFVTCLVVSMICLLNSCGHNVSTAPDNKYISDFHQKYFVPKVSTIKENELSLYVDYSICVSLGQHSSFFQALVPSWVSTTKHYYSIKGSDITEEDIDIYTELKNIKEVHYADLKRASLQIVNMDSEGVLITDGEYFNPTIAKGNISNPYMKDAFEIWLKKGHDIYIFAEPYVEFNNGKSYNKKRFYFLFTDSRLRGNIYSRICQTVQLEEYPDVESFHLSADHPVMMAEGINSKINNTLAASVLPNGNYEIQDWAVDWSSIQNIIMVGQNSDTGDILSNGECIISGLKVDRNSYGGFRITDIDIKVSDINVDYFNYYNERENSIESSPELTSVVNCPNFLICDKDEFNNHGIVNLYFDTNFYNPSFLLGTPFNYFKIDILVAKCENVFKNYTSMFNFDSIDSPGSQNVSVTESVKQCLVNPEIQKMMNNAVLYTIYVKSNKY